MEDIFASLAVKLHRLFKIVISILFFMIIPPLSGSSDNPTGSKAVRQATLEKITDCRFENSDLPWATTKYSVHEHLLHEIDAPSRHYVSCVDETIKPLRFYFFRLFSKLQRRARSVSFIVCV